MPTLQGRSGSGETGRMPADLRGAVRLGASASWGQTVKVAGDIPAAQCL